MLTLSELRRAARVLDTRFRGHRLQRIVQPDERSLVLTFYGPAAAEEAAATRHLLLSCRDEFARVSECASSPRAPETPPAFASFLRARLKNAKLRGAQIRGQDRQLALILDSAGEWCLLLSILGRRANLYVLTQDGELTRALRPLEQTRPELSFGEPWRDPASPLGDEGGERWSGVSDAAYLAAIEKSYALNQSEKSGAELTRRVTVALRRERKSADRRRERIEAELDEADLAAELQRRGELLKVALPRIAAGADEVRANDFETGAEVVIPLDPALTAKQNLAATFKRYHKLVRRLSKAGGQVERARERCEELASFQAEFQGMEREGGIAEIEAFADRSQIAELLEKHSPAEKRRGSTAQRVERERSGPFKNVPTRLQPNRYRSRDGLEIWVGRNDAGNDHLTTRLARGKDLFFHLDGAPGSHVILRTEGRDAPEQSLLDACELAVHFSKARKASRADVHVVPIKQVKKPKGAKPGLVWVTGGHTIHLRRESARLERVLGARIEG